MQVGVQVLAMVLAVACGGKSVRTEASNEERAGNGGAPAGGGATVTNGGATATGGSGAQGESGGTAGSGSMKSCSQPLGSFYVGCDYEHAVRQHCARSGCHDASSAVAGLDLTPDEFLVARVLNVPASFAGIQVNGIACIPAGCPEPGSKLLVRAGDPWQVG